MERGLIPTVSTSSALPILSFAVAVVVAVLNCCALAFRSFPDHGSHLATRKTHRRPQGTCSRKAAEIWSLSSVRPSSLPRPKTAALTSLLHRLLDVASLISSHCLARWPSKLEEVAMRCQRPRHPTSQPHYTSQTRPDVC
jgi:hypothetical protein